MVNNYDRIYSEIEKHAVRIAPKGVSPDLFVELVMEVVDLEDRKVARINQQVESRVRAMAVRAAGAHAALRDDRSTAARSGDATQEDV